MAHISSASILIIIVIVLWIVIIYKKYHNRRQNITNQIKENNKKKNRAVKILNNKVIKIDDVRDFVYSIKELYYYNPPAFSEMTENIHLFFKYKDDSDNDPDRLGIYLEKMIKKKNMAINALSSIIYSIDNHSVLINKLDRAVRSLEFILLPYINIVFDNHKKFVDETGYNNQTKIITSGPVPSNSYEIKPTRHNITDKFTYAII
jgi:hypothetical protein